MYDQHERRKDGHHSAKTPGLYPFRKSYMDESKSEYSEKFHVSTPVSSWAIIVA